jgi:hypothetical protein
MAQFGETQFGETQFDGETDGPVLIDVPTAALVLTGFPPELEHRPPAGVLTLTGFPPIIAIGHPAIEPPTAALVLTGLVPLAFETVIINVPTGALVLTGFAPSYKEAPNIIVPTGTLTITGMPGPTLKYLIRFDMLYNLRQRFTHDMNYSLLAPVQVTHDIEYDLQVGNPLQKQHDMVYGLPFRVFHDMPYSLQTVIQKTHDMVYGLLTNITVEHDMLYDILSVDPVRRTHDMRYSLLSAVIIDVTGVMQILFETSPGVTRSIGVERASVAKDETDLFWTCTVSLTDISDYALFSQDSPFTLSLFGEEWEFIVDSKELSRSDPAGFNAQLQGVSPAANDDLPRALELTQEYPNDISARVVVEGALSIAVEWRDFVDWIIPAGRLSAERASPVDFAQNIVDAAGGFLESKKDGTWLVRHKWPVSPLWYGSTAPDHIFNEQDKILTAREQFVPGRIVNRIRITDGDSNFNDVIEFVADENNLLQGTLFIYPSPFRTTIQLLTTNLPADINLQPTSPTVQEREVVDLNDENRGELIEFENCEGNTVRAIYGISDVEWVTQDLGAVTFEEGSTTLKVSGPSGYGIARVKYTTRFLRYIVTATQPIDGQFILEDIG